MSKILIPIKPEYVDKILSGNKKYEYRKIKPKRKVDKMIIYSTYPIMKVVGEVEIINIIEDNIHNLWESTNQYSGISKDKFYKYFNNKNIGFAYKLGKVIKYDKTKKLTEIGINYTPQSFIYLD